MGPPQAPPRGKKGNPSPREESDDEENEDNSYDGEDVPTGSGYNAAVASPVRGGKKGAKGHINSATPETTIGQNVTMKGELAFERLLRVDGKFTGTLSSKGDLIVGLTGILTGNITGMGEVLIDGKVVGDISCERLTLTGHATIHGNVTCKSMVMSAESSLIGTMNIHPAAPLKLLPDGSVVEVPVAKPAPAAKATPTPAAAVTKPIENTPAPVQQAPASVASTPAIATPAAAPVVQTPVAAAAPAPAPAASPLGSTKTGGVFGKKTAAS